MIKNLELYTTVHINIMFKKSLYIFLVCLASKVHGHLILNIPEVWGIDDGTSLEQPLDTSTANPVCAGRSPENNGVVNFEAGQTYDFDVSCGEKDINSGGCLVGDWHSGDPATDYSGCALGVNYDGYESQDNYKYISYSKDCGKRGEPTSFTITTNIQDCERCVCSWSWAPSRQYSSPGQFYHNCFYCSISGGKMNATMRPLDFINVRGAQYQDATYNSINPSDIYDDSPQPEQEQPEQEQPEQEQPEQEQPEQEQPEQEQPEYEHHEHEQLEQLPQPEQEYEQEYEKEYEKEEPKDDEYDLYKQFKEYQEYKKLKESLDKECDHAEDTYPKTVNLKKNYVKNNYTKKDSMNNDYTKKTTYSKKLYKRHLGEELYEDSIMPTPTSPTSTQSSDTFIKDGKLCRYKTITKTICKPTNYLV
jgi:flagellar motor protein MotB